MADTVFTNVQILDGSGGGATAGEVRVQGNRIRDVAARVDHEGAEVVDGGGATLMPGLVEAHAHPSFTNTTSLEGMGALPPEEHTLLTMRHAKLMLDQGFTSLCCAASAKPRLDIVIRNAIEAGEIPGPRMLAATPEMTVSGGLGDIRLSHMQDRQSFEIICDGPDDFRRVSRQMCREGVDTLKINPSGDEFVPCAKANQTVMNDEEVAAVCEVARSRDKRVAAHARSAESVKMCVRHGVEIVYHATLCDEEARDMLESVKDTVFVAPTLGITIATLFEASDWGITEEVATDLGLRRELEIAVENMKDLKKRGVRVLPGGDYGFAWNPVGANARDLEHFVNYLGYSPMEAIVAATKLGGEIMMKGSELGQVRKGYLADLLLVDGDPVLDVSILQDQSRLLGIMKDGAFHKRPPAMLAAQRAAA